MLKNGVSDAKIQKKVDEILDAANIVNIDMETIRYAWTIKGRYNYSYWDCLVLASALKNGCSILYTEDMHDEQVIEKTLKIVNLFK